MATVILTLRCPHCKFSLELNGDGRAKCCFCDRQIDINRYN